MNIIMFVDRFFPYIGGVEKHTFKIAQKFIDKGHKVTIITRNDKQLLSKEIYENIEIIRLNVKSPATKFKIYGGIIKNINKIINADVIHFHDYSTFYYWYIPFRYLLPWKKIYITFHGWEGQVPPNKEVIKIRKQTEKLTRGNICVGDFISKWYGTKSNKVIYGASDIKANCEIIKNDNFLFVGRLEEDTGIIQYLNIILILKEKYRLDVTFEICGDGALRDTVLEILRQNEIKFKFNGFVEEPEKYMRCAKYCFTSGYLGILEAMQNECLVISVYDNELKKDYLTLMPCKEYMIIGNKNEEIAKEIFLTMNDEKIKDKIYLAKKWADQQTWERISEEYLDLWKK